MNQTSRFKFNPIENSENKEISSKEIEIEAVKRIFGDSYNAEYILNIKSAAISGSSPEEIISLL